jgi:hypothetical protein
MTSRCARGALVFVSYARSGLVPLCIGCSPRTSDDGPRTTTRWLKTTVAGRQCGGFNSGAVGLRICHWVWEDIRGSRTGARCPGGRGREAGSSVDAPRDRSCARRESLRVMTSRCARGVLCCSPPKSLSENGEGFCLGGKGSIGKARGGSRPAAVCDRQATPPAGPSLSNPPGGGSFRLGLRWFGRNRPQEVCPAAHRLAQPRIPPPQNPSPFSDRL